MISFCLLHLMDEYISDRVHHFLQQLEGWGGAVSFSAATRGRLEKTLRFIACHCRLSLLFEIQMLSEVSWRLCFLSLLPLWLLTIVKNEGYDGTNVGFRLFSGPVVVFMVAAGSPSLFSQCFASSTVPGTGVVAVVAVVAASRGDTPCCTCNTREYASSRSWSPLPSPCPANPCNPCSRFSSPYFMLEMVSWCGLLTHRGFCSQKQWVSSVCVCACAH